MRHSTGYKDRTTICLPPTYMTALRELANGQFKGNVSAAVASLIESHPVTKSMLVSSALAT